MQKADREVLRALGLVVAGLIGIALIATEFFGIDADSWVAIFTLTLTISTVGLWMVTHRTLVLSREEFIASDRPQLRVRLVRVDPLETAKPIIVHFVVSNVGTTDAISVSGHVTIQVIRVVEGNWGFDSEPAVWTSSISIADVLAPGERKAVRVASETRPEPDWNVRSRLADGRVQIHGEVNCRDKNGIARSTGFYRFSTADVNRFRLPHDSDIQRDYEYED